MAENEINELIIQLETYSNQCNAMVKSDFSAKTVKAFKTYYNTAHLKLIDHIRSTKDKNLAEHAKEIQSSDDIFKHTDKLVAIFGTTIVFSTIFLIYLYFIEARGWLMITATGIAVVAISILMRKVQSQPENMIENLEKNGRKIKEITVLLKNKI